MNSLGCRHTFRSDPRVYLSNMRIFPVILLTLSILGSAFPDQIDKDSLLSHYGSRISGHDHFTAGFTQSRYLAMFGKPLVSKGTVSFAAPDSFKLHYRDPFESVILFAGGTMRRYVVENGTYVEQPSMEIVAKAISKEMIRWLSGSFGDDFPYEVTIDPGNQRKISLSPKSAAARAIFSTIELVIAAKETYIESIRLNEPSGDYILIEHEPPDFSELDPHEFTLP